MPDETSSPHPPASAGSFFAPDDVCLLADSPSVSPGRESNQPWALTGRVVTASAVLEDGAVVVVRERIAWVGPVAAVPAAYAAAVAAARTESTDSSTTGRPGGQLGSGQSALIDVISQASPVPAGGQLGPGPSALNQSGSGDHSTPTPPRIILPGLVDLHCHGGGGESFPDATSVAAARTAAQEHLRHGTTSLVASTVTAAPDTLVQRVTLLAELAQAGELAGIHAEGPFLSPQRPGAQNPDFLQTPTPQLVRRLAQAARGHLVTMTIAPEIPGNATAPAPVPAPVPATDQVTASSPVTASPPLTAPSPESVIAALAESGALPSFGHTDCSAGQMDQAIAEATTALAAPGTRSSRPTITHLFNGMRPFSHRDPGPIMSALAAAARDEVVVELVADGVHLDPATVKEVFDLVGPDNIALVTDAMAAAGMPDGNYRLGPVAVEVKAGVARLAGGGAIAGGTAHLLDILRVTVRSAGVGLVEATRAASLTPAIVLGKQHQFGCLKAGLQANLIVTDQSLNPVAVYRDGQLV